METIIYFNKKRGLRKPEIEPVGLKKYMLIRVGMNVGEDEWFGLKFPTQPKGKIAANEMQGTDQCGQWESDNYADSCGDSRYPRHILLRTLCHPVKTLTERHRQKKNLRKEEMRRRAEEQERKCLAEEQEAWNRGVERAIRGLWAEIMELAEGQRECSCVYDDSVRRFLIGRKVGEKGFLPEEMQELSKRRGNLLPLIWQQCFEVKEFQGYCQSFWVEELLGQAVWPHYMVLGTAPCIYSVIEAHADKMKSLRWIILERDCSQELLTFVEDFYTEYGLAIALQTLTGTVAFKNLQIKCDLPTNIFDFTSETKIGITEAAEGSIWLDMQSLEEKRRRILGRVTGIKYVSLKERWKTAQRRCKPPILP